jgi:hypothetical protein
MQGLKRKTGFEFYKQGCRESNLHTFGIFSTCDAETEMEGVNAECRYHPPPPPPPLAIWQQYIYIS